LVLAKERNLPLLVDEKKGRAVAKRLGVSVLGLAGLLLLAVERAARDPGAADQLLTRAREQGFRLSERLLRSFREALAGLDD
jgi:predicted nucleic acid-binding protein